MNEQNNREISYIEAVKFTDILFPPKSQKDYHKLHWQELTEEFEKNVNLYKLGISEEKIKDLKKYIEESYINYIGYNDELRLETKLRPQSINAQLFLSNIKFFLPAFIVHKDYRMLQQRDGENAFNNIGDIDEIRDYITKENIHNYINEVLSSAIETKYLSEIEDGAIAKEILLHFGLSPISNSLKPGYVPEIIDIIRKNRNIIEENYILEDIYTAEEMSKLFSGAVDEITEYVQSICKNYLDEIIAKEYLKKLNTKK